LSWRNDVLKDLKIHYKPSVSSAITCMVYPHLTDFDDTGSLCLIFANFSASFIS